MILELYRVQTGLVAYAAELRADFNRQREEDRRNFSKLGKLTTQASKYMKKEWQAMNRILQDENLEISNNLDERMMRRIKLNLKNCLNIGREDSALDYAFMYFVSESYDINGDGI